MPSGQKRHFVLPNKGGQPLTYYQQVRQLYDLVMLKAGLTKAVEGCAHIFGTYTPRGILSRPFGLSWMLCQARLDVYGAFID